MSKKNAPPPPPPPAASGKDDASSRHPDTVEKPPVAESPAAVSAPTTGQEATAAASPAAIPIEIGADNEVQLEEGTLPPQDEDAYRTVKKNRSFGRFELLMEMSQGGMATLYLARISGPEGFEKLLAIKKIHDHLSRKKEFVKMFLDEARIAARIEHPNVAAIYDMGAIEDTYFIAMEYVHGQNLTELLRALIRQKRKLPWPYAARIVIDAAFGLHAAHELKSPTGNPLNVVHRDVSPQNLLISYEGHVKVVDFGIAYAAERLGETKTGTLKGKAAYMSPEQANAQRLDRRSDIFSLGIVLYEAVCLRRLFREENEAATLLKVRDAQVPPPTTVRSDIPAGLEQIIMKCLAKNPDERYATAGELAEALEELMVTESQAVNPNRLSKLVKRVFYDKKKIKDKQIEQCLEGKNTETIQAAAMNSTTETSINMVSESSLSQSGSNSKLLITTIVGAAAAVVIAIGILIYFIAGRPDTPKRPKEKNQSTPRAVARQNGDQETRAAGRRNEGRRNGTEGPKSKVKLKVSVRPTGADATIAFRGKKYSGPHFQALVPSSQKLENLTITAPGFQTETLAVTLDENQRFNVSLRPKKQIAGRPPRRAGGRDVRGRKTRRRPPRRRRRRRPRRRTSRTRLLINDLE
jgi:serine/threonine-protein kinase